MAQSYRTLALVDTHINGDPKAQGKFMILFNE